jgi:hypothetical protein
MCCNRATSARFHAEPQMKPGENGQTPIDKAITAVQGLVRNQS